MHISDGVLSETLTGQAILAGGTLLALAGTAVGLRKIDYEQVPRVAVLTSAFFVASLIHVKVGPTSVHLILNGLVGVMLGWAAFPALLIGLFLQAIFFGHGGITTLGLNTANFAFPARLSYLLFNGALRRARSKRLALTLGFAAGAIALTAAALLVTAELIFTGEEFEALAQGVFLAHLPIAVIEGLVTAAAVAFLQQVRPELLDPPYAIKRGIIDEQAD
jgi:cobalt/nickel transport system permease protein